MTAAQFLDVIFLVICESVFFQLCQCFCTPVQSLGFKGEIGTLASSFVWLLHLAEDMRNRRVGSSLCITVATEHQVDKAVPGWPLAVVVTFPIDLSFSEWKGLASQNELVIVGITVSITLITCKRENILNALCLLCNCCALGNSVGFSETLIWSHLVKWEVLRKPLPDVTTRI